MQSVPVPPKCIRSRGVVQTACVEGIYGIEVSASLRSPARLTSIALDNMRQRANISSRTSGHFKCIAALPLCYMYMIIFVHALNVT